jgi:hypothetical protein
MKSLFIRVATCLCSSACLGQSMPDQDAARKLAALFGQGMVQPAPPRAGDAQLSCVQIAREMADNLRARKVQIDTGANAAERCDAPSQPTEATMAQAASAMRAMNDPRLLRLALLAQEKSCVLKDPVPPADQCASKPAAASPPAANAPNAGKIATAPPAPPSARPDPFRPR